MSSPSAGLLRDRGDGHRHARVGFVELFFDLVFVFAVTQISHSLIEHLDPLGAVQAAVILAAIWWGWVNTAWVTNWLDPERTPVRALLFVMMAFGLVMSASIPEAFGDRGAAFGLAFAALQLTRTLFMLWASRPSRPLFLNFVRITVWHALSASLWVAGGFAPEETRLAWWAAAVAVEFLAPAAYFWLPGLGRSTTADWNVEGHHLAERTGLFIIIALGESILVMGATFAGLAWTADSLSAFAVAFLGSLAMWWIYFSGAADAARSVIAESDDPGRIGRRAYTYCPVVLVAGIIVAAVSDEIILKHPHGHIGPAAAAVILGGPALFLLGSLLFKLAVFGTWSPSRLAGLALLAALAPFALLFEPLPLAAAALGTLLVVSVWESVHLARLKAAQRA